MPSPSQPTAAATLPRTVCQQHQMVAADDSPRTIHTSAVAPQSNGSPRQAGRSERLHARRRVGREGFPSSSDDIPCNKDDWAGVLAQLALAQSPAEVVAKAKEEMRDADKPSIDGKFLYWLRDNC